MFMTCKNHCSQFLYLGINIIITTKCTLVLIKVGLDNEELIESLLKYTVLPVLMYWVFTFFHITKHDKTNL